MLVLVSCEIYYLTGVAQEYSGITHEIKVYSVDINLRPVIEISFERPF